MIAAVTNCKDTAERARSNALQENHPSYLMAANFGKKKINSFLIKST